MTWYVWSFSMLSSLDCLHFPPTAPLRDCPICLLWTQIFCWSCAYFLPVSMATHQGFCLSCAHRKKWRQKMTVVIHASMPGHLSLIHIIKMGVSSFIFKDLPTYPGYYLNVLEKAICKVGCKVDFWKFYPTVWLNVKIIGSLLWVLPEILQICVHAVGRIVEVLYRNFLTPPPI